MVLPRLKSFARQSGNGEVVLIQEAGVEFSFADPDGQILALLDLLDGTRTLDEIARQLVARWPDLTLAQVAEGIAALDEVGLLVDAAADTTLSPRQQQRYFSNLAFFETFATLETSSAHYQERLRDASVVLLGVGGLGSTVLLNLAGLGVGRVTLLDCDQVELKNLVRQFLYSEADVGLPKPDLAAQRILAFNSEMKITTVERRVSGPEDVALLLSGADLLISAIDQPVEVQSWVNQACVAAAVPFISGGMRVARGIYYSIDPGSSGCLSCLELVQQQEPQSAVELRAAERINRAIGPAASLLGSLVALEALRYLTGFATPVAAGKLWVVDMATGRSEVGASWPRMAGCPICDQAPARSLSAAVLQPEVDR